MDRRYGEVNLDYESPNIKITAEDNANRKVYFIIMHLRPTKQN